MGKYFVDVSKEAKQHLAFHHKSGNKATIKKIEHIIVELSETPYTGTGKPEQLKGNLAGHWSRRINQKDRIIYHVDDSVVTVSVISAKGHYGDK
ncbi:Txe/YoeB family addiction module toxin [Parapedobacter sp. DT-150]|uniref:Txe/YoeB family addiction module toxin n=1 Tax=Parapedobacter sp. DT-150 TaxID=3396162 RepID=UPI003F1B5387